MSPQRVSHEVLEGNSLPVLRYAFGRAAHDMNNYLSGFAGYLALLKERFGDQPECARYFGLAEKSAGRMAALVKVLADFSEPGRPDAKPVDVNAAVRGALDQLVELKEGGFDLTFDLDETAPRVVAHSGSLREAIAHVLRNALEASATRPAAVIARTSSGAIAPEALVPPRDGTGPWACIEVEDSGAGMDEATVRSCVVPFFTTKRATDQHGLGLALVRSCVCAWGGGLDVRSTPGAGTTVSLYLRAAER